MEDISLKKGRKLVLPVKDSLDYDRRLQPVSRRDLYRANPALTPGLGFHGLSRRSARLVASYDKPNGPEFNLFDRPLKLWILCIFLSGASGNQGQAIQPMDIVKMVSFEKLIHFQGLLKNSEMRGHISH